MGDKKCMASCGGVISRNRDSLCLARQEWSFVGSPHRLASSTNSTSECVQSGLGEGLGAAGLHFIVDLTTDRAVGMQRISWWMVIAK